MLGRYFLATVVAAIVIVIGMLVYPVVHSNWAGIVVTGFTDLEKAGMIVLSYAFIFFMVYIVWVHVKR